VTHTLVCTFDLVDLTIQYRRCVVYDDWLTKQ